MKLHDLLRVPGAFAALFLCQTDAIAQHPAPVAISSLTAPEPSAFEAQISPDGQFVAFSTWNATSHSLFVRRADASAAAVQVTTIAVSAVAPPFFPRIPFTWRQSTPTTLGLVFGARLTPAGAFDLNEFNPLTSAIVTRATFAGPASGTRFQTLQLHPCRNIVSGVQLTFPGGGAVSNQIWHLNLNGGAPVFQTQAVSANELIPLEMSPNETRGLYSSQISPGSVFEYSVAAPTAQPVTVISASIWPRSGGYRNNARAYAIDTSNGQNLAMFDLPPSTAREAVTWSSSPIYQASAAPGHLIAGSGDKDFIVFQTQSATTNEVKLTPSDYGGEILIANPLILPAPYTNISVDGAASRVALVAGVGNSRQVFVVPTQRQMRALFIHPNGSPTTTYDIRVPCNSNEICFLGMATDLAAAPIPFGPPGSGQIDLGGSAFIAVSSVGVPMIVNAPLAFVPAAVGLMVYFQAARVDLATGAYLNTTRAAGIRYF